MKYGKAVFGAWMCVLMMAAAGWGSSPAPLTEQERGAADQLNAIFRRAAAQVSEATVFIYVSKGQGFAMAEGLGSGVIIDERGYALTNNHVVKDTDRVELVLTDGRNFEADEIMLDPDTDLALVHFDPKGQELPVAHLGDSDTLRVGDFVLAIGCPFGLEQTVTMGTVSFLGRRTQVLDTKWGYEDFIQTDAVINKGNSGGPLVNLYGEVIGINSNILSMTGTSAGYGFAIPSNLAQFVAKELLEHKVVRRGYLGINMNLSVAELKQLSRRAWERMPPDQAEINELLKTVPEEINGVVVVDVQPDTPAEAAGMQKFDIITEMNGEATTSTKALRNKIAMMPPDTKVHFTVWREGKTQEIEVTLADRNAAKKRDLETKNTNPFAPFFGPQDEGRSPLGTPDDKPRLGVSVDMLTPRLAAKYGLTDTSQGVVIIEVIPGTMAQSFGLQAGEIIRKVNGQDITSIDQLRDLVGKTDLDKEVLKLELESSQGRRTVVIKNQPD